MYLNEWYFEVVALVVDYLLQSCEVVHDEGFLSWFDQVDAVGEGDHAHTYERKELAISTHDNIIF